MAEETLTEEVELPSSGVAVEGGMAIDPATGQALTAEDIAALPEAEQDTEAVTQTEDTHAESRQESTESDEEDEDPNLKWLKKTGIDPSDPDALKKAAKIARNSVREAREQPEQSELDKAFAAISTPQAPAYQPPAYQPYQQPYYDPNAPVAPQYDQYGQPIPQQPYMPQYQYQPEPIGPSATDLKMNLVMFNSSNGIQNGTPLNAEFAKIVASDVAYYASSQQNLDKALKIAKATLLESTIEDRIEEARREEREKLSRKSALSRPNGQSSTATTPGATINTPAEAERFIATHSQDEVNERIDELERVLGIQLAAPKKKR